MDGTTTRNATVAEVMKVYTVEEVAERLGITKHKVSCLLRQGQLPYVDVSITPGGLKPRKRIREDDLMVFLEARRVQRPDPNAPRRRRRIRSLEQW